MPGPASAVASRLSPVAVAARTGCEDVADQLAGINDGTAQPGPRAAAHLKACLRCQAELVRYRRLGRVLASLRNDVVEPAPGSLASLLATLQAAGQARAVHSLLSGRRGAYLGGALLATAASAAGAVLWATRRRVGFASP
ncbi:MAG: hypothetical protein ACRDY0_05990 [Acidimicrobiales bacterium]